MSKSVKFELQKDQYYRPGDVLLAVPTEFPVGSDEASDMRHEEEWHSCESRFDVMYSVNLMLKEHGLQLVTMPNRVSQCSEQSYIRVVPLSMKPERDKVFEDDI